MADGVRYNNYKASAIFALKKNNKHMLFHFNFMPGNRVYLDLHPCMSGTYLLPSSSNGDSTKELLAHLNTQFSNTLVTAEFNEVPDRV